MRNLLKRFACIAVALLMLISATAGAMPPPAEDTTPAKREIYQGDDYIYEVMPDNSISIHFYTGVKTEVTVPAEIDSKPVTTIESLAFYGTGVKSVVISKGITTICEQAFYGATALEKVHIPASVESVGKSAFGACTSLRAVTFEKDAKNALGEYMFTGCSNLNMVKLPENIEKIPAGAFAYCENLNSINLPQGLKEIGEYAFYESGIAYLHLPQSLINIWSYAFVSSKLTSLDFPSDMEYIGVGAFSYCFELTSFYIDAEEICLDNNAFAYCKRLMDINIASYDVTLGNDVFIGCKATYPLVDSPDPTEEPCLTEAPTTEACPTEAPTTACPTEAPTTACPTEAPTTACPTEAPTTACPTEAPTTAYPTDPTEAPPTMYDPPEEPTTDCPTEPDYSVPGAVPTAPTDATEATSDELESDRIYVTEDFFESEHNYKSDTDKFWVIVREGAEYIDLVFSSKTHIEKDWDYIYIYDENGLCGTYTGVDLAGETVRIEGEFAMVQLKTDESVELYGFSCQVQACFRPEDYVTEDNFYVGTHESFLQNEAQAMFAAGQTAANNKKELMELAWNVRTRGDANNDNMVNIKDATAIQKFVAGIIKESADFVKKNADVNQDGTVNVKDATTVQKYVAGLVKI